MNPDRMTKPENVYGNRHISSGPWNPSPSSFSGPYSGNAFENDFYRGPGGPAYQVNNHGAMGTNRPQTGVANTNGWNGIVPTPSSSSAYRHRPSPGVFGNQGAGFGSWTNAGVSPANGTSSTWESIGERSPSNSVDDIFTSPNLSDYSLDNSLDNSRGNNAGKQPKPQGKGRSQRRPNNRDEFDGPHQFLQPPSPEVIASQERELPHLPTNLLVQEQDHVLSQVNERLSQCAFDFVAKYQFPIPLTQDMRPVERPQDREWTEWVYLLKRLATKRRVPARVLYNGQIKQLITVLENSLEMRHAAKHQSRPLKDDRNILQLISAGIQVAKILKDATAMEYLDHLYVSTEKQIAERAAQRYR